MKLPGSTTTALRATLLTSLLAGASTGALSAQIASLPEAAQTKLAEALKSDTPRKWQDELYRLVVSVKGDPELLLEACKEVREDEKRSAEEHLAALRLSSELRRRLGDLSKASRLLSKIPLEARNLADDLAVAEVLDAQGKDAEASAAYQALASKKLDAKMRNRVLLRIALIGKVGKVGEKTAQGSDTGAGAATSTGTRSAGRLTRLTPSTPSSSGGARSVRATSLRQSGRSAAGRSAAGPAGQEKAAPPKQRSALAEFARRKDIPAQLRNQAAVILALQNQQDEAVDIFVAEGKDTHRFRQEVRLAEWALEARLYDKAQAHAWTAVEQAKMKRDRRYALDILVETYRRPGKLSSLLEVFGSKKVLSDEARKVWIDLLRETGKIDEALALFQASAQGGFTTEMRRELLEMCRETGREKTMVEAYEDLISKEPRFLEWRQGLARFYLERGQGPKARSVWKDYLQVTPDPRYRMAAASSLMSLGLDGMAEEFARQVGRDEAWRDQALMFLFELHRERGRLDRARGVLEELGNQVEATARVRQDMAEAYERIGDKREAVRLLDALCKAKGDKANPDTMMKLALLLSETGDEERALDLWTTLWRQINSVPRRRYVEERLMTVASRLGLLAKVAVSLEQKLDSGEADDREAGLLVRIYVRVKDSVSASEIIEEHMKRAGKRPVDVLTEKARVYLSCADYYNYEIVIRELIDVDPEGRSDHLRELAMSCMERGKRKEAREILERLKKEETGSVSDEFEAGLLALAGMREEALHAYRRGLARYPGRIDAYLLLSNMQKELGRHERSAGMFQYLAATAEKDDLFTIAIDGILNMRDGRGNRGAPDRLVRWARRVTLERIAGRPDKLYLYRLVADLSDEIRDGAMSMRALKSALPIAGEQRTPLLRELMAMAKQRSGGNRRNSIIYSRSGSRLPQRREVDADLLMFGRRILGQAELVPPEVYMELGEAFLAAEEVVNATRTFQQMARLPEFAEMRRKIADAFERSGYPKEALKIYEEILSVEVGDTGLLLKVGELQEQIGRDDVALELYEKGLENLLSRTPLSETGKAVATEERNSRIPSYLRNRNSGDYERYQPWLVSGLLATLGTQSEAQSWLSDQRDRLDKELERILADRDAASVAGSRLSSHPRIARRAELYRRVSLAFDKTTLADEQDRKLITAFPEDSRLVEGLVLDRRTWGFTRSARELIQKSHLPENKRRKLLLLCGGQNGETESGILSPSELSSLLLPLLTAGKQDLVRSLLERLDLSANAKSDLDRMPMLVGVSVFLDEPDITLTLCRHWLALLGQHSAASMYGVVESMLRQAKASLDARRFESLTQDLVDRVVSDPDKYSRFVQRLPDMRKSLGIGLLAQDQVQKLIDSRLTASDRFLFGVEGLFRFLSPQDQASVLRSRWGRFPKARRALFLLRFVPVLEEEVSPGFADFLVGAFEESIRTADDKRMLGYYTNQLTSLDVNYPVVLKYLELLEKANVSANDLRGAQIIILDKAGRKEEAKKQLRKVFDAVIQMKGARSTQDHRLLSTWRTLQSHFGSHDFQVILDLYEAAEKTQGKDLAVTRKKLQFLRQQGKTQEYENQVFAMAEAHPLDVAFREERLRILQRQGRLLEMHEIYRERFEKWPKNVGFRRSLEASWRQLRNPIEAKKLRDSEPAEKPAASENRPVTAKTGDTHKKKRREPASLTNLEKEWTAGKRDEGLAEYRRLWRSFSVLGGRMRYYPSYLMGTRRFLWPVKQATRPAVTTRRTPDRGGLPKAFLADKTPAPRGSYSRRYPVDLPGLPSSRGQQGATPPKRRQSVAEVLARDPAGRQEVERQLRSLPPAYLASPAAADLFRALVDASLEESTPKQLLERYLAREKAGDFGKLGYGKLSILLERDLADVESTLRDALPGMLGNVDPKDGVQLRQMARLFAKTGHPEQASLLYRWCGLLSGGSLYPNIGTASDLIEEIIQNLQGEQRNGAIEAVLDSTKPSEYNQDGFDEFALLTWDRLLPPGEVIAKAERTLERVTDMGYMPKRRSCKVATRILARGGETERALRTLEIALCKLPAPNDLRVPYYKTYFERPGYLSQQDIAWLFSKDVTGFADAKTWFEAVGDKLLQWGADGRIEERTLIPLLSILCLRLAEHGSQEIGDKVFARLRDVAGSKATYALWIADLARARGQEKLAHEIERRLLETGGLDLDRLAEVVSKEAEVNGVDAGIALGEKAATWCLDSRFLDALVGLCYFADKPERAAHWEKVATEAKAAEAALRKQDEERRKAQQAARTSSRR